MASLDGYGQDVDLLSTVRVLHEHLTASVCQTVFEQTRTTERAGQWTFGGRILDVRTLPKPALALLCQAL